MQKTLGVPVLEEFRQLAMVHRDGWGAFWTRSGAPSAYVSHCPASRDPVFEAVTALTVDSAIVHERWASPGIGLELDNQQPFAVAGMGFAHNGTIGNDQGNIVQQPVSYREFLGLVGSTTMSDSRLYADLFFLQLDQTRRSHPASREAPTAEDLRQALARTITLLRRDYPDASFNCVVETPDFTVAARAHAEPPRPGAELRRGYEAAGWSHRVDTYYELGYTTLRHADGSVTSVASSSGYVANDRWTRLANNTLVVMSHRDAGAQVRPLEALEKDRREAIDPL